MVFNEGLLSGKELAPKFLSPDPVGMDYLSYSNYIDRALPAESPSMFGLHTNAEIGYLSSNTETLFGTIMKLQAGVGGGRGGGDKGEGVGDGLRGTLEDLLGKCPHQFELLGLAERAKPLVAEAHGPFVLVAQQEAGRMNELLVVIMSTLSDLRKGLNGQLNMSQPMEDLAEALTLMQVPGRDPFSTCSWEKSAWPSTKGLGGWFTDLMQRNRELRKWCDSLVLPKR